MSENRFQAPYQAVQQRHEETRRQALEVLTEAGRQIDTWEADRPRLLRHLGRRVGVLWKDRLGLRTFPWPWRTMPVLSPRRIDRRLRRFRRRGPLREYREGLARLSGVARSSWPARRLRFGMAFAALRLRVSPLWALVLLAALLLALVDAFAPSVLEDFLDLFVGGR